MSKAADGLSDVDALADAHARVSAADSRVQTLTQSINRHRSALQQAEQDLRTAANDLAVAQRDLAAMAKSVMKRLARGDAEALVALSGSLLSALGAGAADTPRKTRKKGEAEPEPVEPAAAIEPIAVEPVGEVAGQAALAASVSHPAGPESSSLFGDGSEDSNSVAGAAPGAPTMSAAA